MISISKHSLGLLFLFITTAASAQYIQVDDTYTAQQLVDALVANSCSQVSNVSVNGSNISGQSYGYFSAASSDFPFANGLVLSSGFATSAVGPNNQGSVLSQGSDTWAGDSDLEDALNIVNTFNATILEFDFVPLTTSISFDYLLASEEYLEVVDFIEYCDFSDGFAFLLKPVGSTQPYQNLAVIPNTDIPVKVTTVRGGGMCPAANAEYFGGYNDFDNATAFNGQTAVLTAKADVTPGVTYHIKLVIADQGDTQFDSAIFLGGGSFGFNVNLGEDRLIAANNPVCSGNNIPLTAAAGADSYKWYRDDILQAGNANTFNVTDTGTYKVEAAYASCVYTGDIKLEYAPAISRGNVTYTQCDENNDGLTAYYLPQITQELFTDAALTLVGYYLSAADANNNANPINTIPPFYNTIRDQVIYARLQNQYGCTANTPVTLATNSISSPVLPAYELCESNGLYSGTTEFNLQEEAADILASYPPGSALLFYYSYDDALALRSPLPGNYTNVTPRSQTIFARIDSNSGCSGITPLQLIVHGFAGDFTNRDAIICDNTTITLDAEAGYSSYSWDTPTPVLQRFLTVNEPGIYTVTVTNSFGCESTKTFDVRASGPAISATVSIDDFAGNLNAININITQGISTYQYALDGNPYQDAPFFTGVEAGKHTVSVRDTNGCGPDYQKTFYVLDYPRMFSPNGDGINDTWFIPYMYSRPDITVTVFDRYARLIKSFTGTSSGWDGTVNGQRLPASDYWFILQLENGNTVKGHFSLLR